MIVTFEGPDGVGKTTTIEALEVALEAKGYMVKSFGPHYTSFGVQVHALCKGAISDTERILLYTASYTYVLRLAREWLRTQKRLGSQAVVLMDRLFPSAFVYNNEANEIIQDLVENIWVEFPEYTGFQMAFVFLEGQTHKQHDKTDFYEVRNDPNGLATRYNEVITMLSEQWRYYDYYRVSNQNTTENIVDEILNRVFQETIGS